MNRTLYLRISQVGLNTTMKQRNITTAGPANPTFDNQFYLAKI